MRWLTLGLLALFAGAACGRCGSAQVADGGPEAAPSTVNSSQPLDGEVVRRAYAALAVGRVEEARALFATIGGAAPVSADDVANAFSSAPGASRGLLRNAPTCGFGDLGPRCFEALSQHREGGTCDAGKLTTSCALLAVDAEGRLLETFWHGEAQVRGRYLVTYSPGGLATIKDIDTFGDLVSIQGEVVSEIDSGKKLVAVSNTSWIEARVIDPEAHHVSGPCRFADPGSTSVGRGSPPEVRLVAGGTRLIVREAGPLGRVTLCRLDPVRVTVTLPTEGKETWLLDRAGRTLFVSGIVRDKPGDVGRAIRAFDHAAVDLMSGTVQRVHVKERAADIPGRNMLLSEDGETLAVGSHAQISWFSTKPFRYVDALKLEIDFGSFDSSYNLTPQWTPLLDGHTALAAIESTENRPPDGRPVQVRHVWLVSLATRRLLVRGMQLTDVHENPKTRRSAFALETTSGEKRLVVVDDQGAMSGRDLIANETVPPEFASMVRHPDPPRETAPTVDRSTAARLAANLCSVGGLFVPLAACPAHR